MKIQLILAAAGLGVRLGKGPKSLVELGGKPLFIRTLERLAPLNLLDDAVILHPAGYANEFTEVLAANFPNHQFGLCEGGSVRQISIRNGLDMLAPDTEIVVIHDAARPFVSTESVRQSISAAAEFGAATVAIPVTDTILHGDQDAFLIDTPDRTTLWACQTPQTFRVDFIRLAHDQAQQQNFLGTDDASLVRRLGNPVKLVMGTPLNMKITTAEDLALAEFILTQGLGT